MLRLWYLKLSEKFLFSVEKLFTNFCLKNFSLSNFNVCEIFVVGNMLTGNAWLLWAVTLVVDDILSFVLILESCLKAENNWLWQIFPISNKKSSHHDLYFIQKHYPQQHWYSKIKNPWKSPVDCYWLVIKICCSVCHRTRLKALIYLRVLHLVE